MRRPAVALLLPALLAFTAAATGDAASGVGTLAIPWSTIVDNSTAGRFTASAGWGTSTYSSQRYGADYRYANPNTTASDVAWYKVAIPESGSYTVSVWYAANAGYNDSTPYIVATTAGNQTIRVNQRANGGRWVSLGQFNLAAGDANVVGVSRWTSGTGYVIADAIQVAQVPTTDDPVLVGAGDIANSGSADSATANLLDGIPGTIFTAGDNAYPDGSASNFTTYYEPTWGRHKARTRPSPGNHDYVTAGASAYYNYFGVNAGPSGRGYYSYDLGNWHIVSLNSEVSMATGSAQEQWLRQDLAASTKPCTLAYWHRPRFTSGSLHAPSTATGPLVQALYEFNAEVIVTGHNHHYERFAPMNPGGTLDNTRGIRHFVAGMAGAGFYTFGTIQPNSQARNNDTNGVLKFTLHSDGYTWQFVPVAGKTYTDSGTTACH
ncbi:MAG TPA: metallophosphoesterase [Candidatus Limnocylindrales bacterium]